jgi:predicted hydrocarbon binding protein
VKRLNPQAYLPKFEYETGKNNELIMFYTSKRKLCHASVGLIKGAAEHFKQEIQISHPECMHNAAKRCKLVIDFKE